MDYSSRLKSKMAYVYDSDEEQEEEEDMLLACILVSEYLEEREERTKFYVRERIVWEHHIAELTKEGDEAFQQTFCVARHHCSRVGPKGSRKANMQLIGSA